MKSWLVLILLAAIAFGVNWTAYESHIANEGVAAMTTALSQAQPQPRPQATPPNDAWKWKQPNMGEKHPHEGFSL